MYDERPYSMYCGPNDGGVKRGDRADTGDLEANPSETVSRGGSGVRSGNKANIPAANSGFPTGDAGALADGPSPGPSVLEEEAIQSGSGGIDDLTIYDATEPSLGLTGIGDVPPDDWAADTGETQTDEGGTAGVNDDAGRRGSTLDKSRRPD